MVLFGPQTHSYAVSYTSLQAGSQTCNMDTRKIKLKFINCTDYESLEIQGRVKKENDLGYRSLHLVIVVMVVVQVVFLYYPGSEHTRVLLARFAINQCAFALRAAWGGSDILTTSASSSTGDETVVTQCTNSNAHNFVWSAPVKVKIKSYINNYVHH